MWHIKKHQMSLNEKNLHLNVQYVSRNKLILIFILHFLCFIFFPSSCREDIAPLYVSSDWYISFNIHHFAIFDYYRATLPSSARLVVSSGVK